MLSRERPINEFIGRLSAHVAGMGIDAELLRKFLEQELAAHPETITALTDLSRTLGVSRSLKRCQQLRSDIGMHSTRVLPDLNKRNRA